MSTCFFDEMSEQSEVKALLVQKYFKAWAKVMIGVQNRNPVHPQRIAYIDLFAGPGRYKDGSISTPLSVLKIALEEDEIRQRLITIFNDKDADKAESLLQAINELPGVESLKYPPKVINVEVGENIAQQFESMKLVPTLFFIDPWGYKGLSARLINSVIKDFGCDCIFFFNYNRINMSLNNDFVLNHMRALFGDDKVDEMRKQMDVMSPLERELFITNEIGETLRGMGTRYVLPFTFKNANGTRTSHHLIFVSKHVRGYEIMKEIMARHSSSTEQGVASFDFNPVDNRQLSLLFDLSRPLDELSDALLERFAGCCLTMEQIYNAHHVGTPYIKGNYKKALAQLEAQGRIQCFPPAEKRPTRKGERTFSNNVEVLFPKN